MSFFVVKLQISSLQKYVYKVVLPIILFYVIVKFVSILYLDLEK